MLVLIFKYLYKNGRLKNKAEYCFKRDITDKWKIIKGRQKSRSAAYSLYDYNKSNSVLCQFSEKKKIIALISFNLSIIVMCGPLNVKADVEMVLLMM